MFTRGDQVRLIKDCKALHCGDQVFKAGRTGKLGQRYRIQDGLEIWHLDLDQPDDYGYFVFIAVTHLDIEHFWRSVI